MFRARILLKVCSKKLFNPSYTYVHVHVHVCCVSVSYMYHSITTWEDNSMVALHFNTKVQIISLKLWPYFSYNLQGTTLNNILGSSVYALIYIHVHVHVLMETIAIYMYVRM